jgi:tripartite-type tricarboxylate transporter receptor subunit TctC
MKTPSLSRTLRAIALFAAVACPLAQAQDGKVVRIIVPYPPGGATDALARTLATKLGPELDQNVVVDNRPGASGQIGTAFVKGAPADGSTFLFTSDHPIVTLPHLVAKAGYEPLKDFVAVGQVARFSLALSVASSTGAKTLNDFSGYVRANPAKASYGVPVVGGFPSSVGVAVARKIGVPMVAVPFPGSGPVVLNVAGNQVIAGVTGLGDALPLAKAEKVRIVAITGAQRSKIFPDIPTFEELGYPGLAVASWYAFFAPAGTPRAVAQRFNTALVKVLNDPEVKARILEMSIDWAPTTLDESAAEFKAAAGYWTEAAKSPDFVRP